jgi:hypothetical protein
MSKKTFFVLILLLQIIILPGIFAADVNIDSNTSLNTSIFFYNIYFNNDDNINSFSFEVPKDAILISAVSENNSPLFYSKAGDFFIFKPDGDEKTFKIIFSSKSVSENILKTNSYSVYVNFNIPINNLKFTLNLLDNISKINDVFPRNYLIDSENKKIEWNLKNFTDYSLFLVKFDEINNLTENNENNKSMFGILITILILSLIIIIIKLLIKYKKLELNFIKNKNIPKENEKLEENVLNLNLSLKEEDKNNIEDNKIDFEKYLNEYAEKYLTENEKEVLFVIKNNEGILQNEILNYLPKLNKSTLSKIISKLETKKVLNKIKVGKVNKIFLGEKFKNLK